MPSLPVPIPKSKAPIGWAVAELKIEDDVEPPITGWFNPKDYTVKRSNSWKPPDQKGNDVPIPEYGGGSPATISVTLLIDRSDRKDGDVLPITRRLFRIMDAYDKFKKPDAKVGRPPKVTFSWGSVELVTAWITSLSVQYLLFRPDGIPIRAQVALELTQAERAKDGSNRPDPGSQNPTTRGDVREAHVVREGDSLQSIAYAAFGDATRWRAIAKANDIDDPLRLLSGSELGIPRNPE